MHATLTFNLPEEKEEFLMAAGRGWDWYGIVLAVKRELRDRRKYKCETSVDIEEVEALIYEELQDRGLVGEL